MFGILLIEENKSLEITKKSYLKYPNNEILLVSKQEAKKLCNNATELASYEDEKFKISYKVVDYTTGMFIE